MASANSNSESSIDEICKGNYFKTTDSGSNLWYLSSIDQPSILIIIGELEGIPKVTDRKFNVTLNCSSTSSEYGIFVLSWSSKPQGNKSVHYAKSFLFFDLMQTDIVFKGAENCDPVCPEKPLLSTRKLMNIQARLILKSKNVFILQLRVLFDNKQFDIIQLTFTKNQSLIEPFDFHENKDNNTQRSYSNAVYINIEHFNDLTFHPFLIAEINERNKELAKVEWQKLKKIIIVSVIVVFLCLIIFIRLYKIYHFNKVVPFP